ncbi:hypothetical protein BN159_0749 [Streptomyces davaonensis JCM 4913]|uniref:ABM domain-containing protein n=1 Tax=Streptomyces davaonensis (strain DSM 101723 / JCM 4913 / KCC S-0913 / 768) TaxID=1214101 RepID=K4QVR3_STRDJ|nr:hypothetical protein [Streptomyces davaonensis]CCK25128.1 hypothetical protein BN159_0749 [Streptomyces davaonensis JCM 4913]
MAIAVNIHWQEITPDLYETARSRVRWDEDVPDGLVLHASWFDGGLHVLDVWESEGQFSTFIAERIAPVLKGELNVQSDPQVTMSPLHRHFVVQQAGGAA